MLLTTPVCSKVPKFAFKFNRQIEGVETCDCTVVADNRNQALEKLKAEDYKTFLITEREYGTTVDEDNFILSFREMAPE